jgi:hypothetical protein
VHRDRVLAAWRPLSEAAESALRRGDAVRAPGSLLTVTENVLWSWRTEHTTDEDAVALWQRVLTALPAGESGLRAAREARTARDLHRRLGWGPWERLSQELLERAVELLPDLRP